MLMYGDCLDCMNDIESRSIDLVLADVPYGRTNCRWDSLIPLEPMWKHLKRVTKPNSAIILTAQTPFDKVLGVSNLPMLKYEWIWEKTAATGHLNAKRMPMKAHENILVFYNKPPTYNPQKTQGHDPVHSYSKRINSDGDCYGQTTTSSGGGNTDRYPRSIQVFKSDKQKSKLHSTQKPLGLMEYLIKTYSNAGDTVLDFCMGSGTTGLAAQNLQRKFIGIEKDQEYFEIARARIQSLPSSLIGRAG